MAKKPEDATAEAAAPKKSKKLVVIGGILVLALGGGAGAWYFMRPVDPDAPKAVEHEKPSQFLALESFTVNLAGAEGAPQYLQAGLTLKLGHQVKLDVIKERMPEIRNHILLTLSAKKASEILPAEGKQKLAGELSTAIREMLGESAGLAQPAKPAKKKAKAKAETEAEAEAEAENADEAADGEAKPRKKAPEKATHVVKNDVQVLFTSFIVQ